MPLEQTKELAISQLHFDPLNPRLPAEARIDEYTVLQWMLRNGDLIDLMSSIGATGYSDAEPLLAIKNNEGKYVVVEGNRRLAALKLLSNPAIAPIKKKSVLASVSEAVHKPENVPVVIYTEREDILAYLGYRHITGVKAWGPLQKARYMQQLFNLYSQKNTLPKHALSQIARVAATKPNYAKKILSTLALYDEAIETGFWENDALRESDVEFSVLSTALSYESISGYVEIKCNDDFSLESISKENAKDLFAWLFVKGPNDKARVPESRSLKSLAKVISTPKALDAFRSGRTLDDAARYTDEVDENFRTVLLESLDRIREADNISIQIKRISEDDLEIVRDIFRVAQRIAATLKEKQNADVPF